MFGWLDGWLAGPEVALFKCSSTASFVAIKRCTVIHYAVYTVPKRAREILIEPFAWCSIQPPEFLCNSGRAVNQFAGFLRKTGPLNRSLNLLVYYVLCERALLGESLSEPLSP